MISLFIVCCLGMLIFQVTGLDNCRSSESKGDVCLQSSGYPLWSLEDQYECNISASTRLKVDFEFRAQTYHQDKCPPRLLLRFPDGQSLYVCASFRNNSSIPFKLAENNTSIQLFNPHKINLQLSMNITLSNPGSAPEVECTQTTVSEKATLCPCTNDDPAFSGIHHKEDWGRRLVVGFVSAFVFLLVLGILLIARCVYIRRCRKQKPKDNKGDLNLAYAASRSTLDSIDWSKCSSSIPFTPDPELNLELQSHSDSRPTENVSMNASFDKLRISTDSGLYSEIADHQQGTAPSQLADTATTTPNIVDNHQYASVDEIQAMKTDLPESIKDVPANTDSLPPVPPQQSKRLTEEEIEALYSKPNKLRRLPRESSGPIGSSTPARGSKAGSVENLAIHPSFMFGPHDMSTGSQSFETDV